MSTNHHTSAEEFGAPYTELKSTESLKKSASELGAAVKEISSGAVREIEARAKAAVESVGEGAQQVSKFLENEIKKSPIISLGLAFGVGLVFSRILFRR